MRGNRSSSLAKRAASGRVPETGPWVPQDQDEALSELLRQNLDEDYEKHLWRVAQLKQCCAGAAVAGTLCVVGLSAMPVLVVGPGKVVLVAAASGAAGGSQLAWQKCRRDGARCGLDCGTVGQCFSAVGQGECVQMNFCHCLTNPRPSLRRLSHAARWASRQLARSSAGREWRQAAFREAVCAFAPWAARAHNFSLRAGSREVDAVSLRHLFPLYRFLQSQVAMEAAMELVAEVAATTKQRSARGALPLITERRNVALATVLVTLEAPNGLGQNPITGDSQGSVVGMIRHLRSNSVAKNVVAASFAASVFGRPRGREKFQLLASTIRGALQPADIQEALSRVPPVMFSDGSATRARSSRRASCDDEEFFSLCDPTEWEGAGSGFQQRSLDFCRGEGPHTWKECDPSNFNVRSRTYLRNRKKEPSGRQMLELLNVDFARIGPDGPIAEVAAHEDFCRMASRRMGERRFLFVMNWIIPPFQAVMTAALDPRVAWLQNPKSAQALAWQRFLDATEQERTKKLKVIFSVDQGPWVVRKLAVKKPTIIGTKVSMTSRHTPGDFLEIVIDVTNGGKGGGYEEMVTGMVLKQAKHLEMVFCVLIEGQQDDELPETALFSASCSHVDFDRFPMPVTGSQ